MINLSWRWVPFSAKGMSFRILCLLVLVAPILSALTITGSINGGSAGISGCVGELLDDSIADGVFTVSAAGATISGSGLAGCGAGAGGYQIGDVTGFLTVGGVEMSYQENTSPALTFGTSSDAGGPFSATLSFDGVLLNSGEPVSVNLSGIGLFGADIETVYTIDGPVTVVAGAEFFFTAVPEPGTWVLVIFGFAIVTRRRRGHWPFDLPPRTDRRVLRLPANWSSLSTLKPSPLLFHLTN